MKQINFVAIQLLAKKKNMDTELLNMFTTIHKANPPKVNLSNLEKAATKKVPKNNPILDDYFGKRRGAQGLIIHSTMRMEVFNFVDGKRSYYDIYKAVLAESLAAGTWYYGIVRLEDVVKLLDANVETGALTLVK
jgi:hypothetical protein